jgi:uncharacterized repeat protein (TIGR03803 family)
MTTRGLKGGRAVRPYWAGLALAAGVFISSFIGAPAARAQTYTVLYSFTGGTDGGNPQGGLISDPAGNLYSTTGRGGASGDGTVFKVTPAGVETVLHSFSVSDGRLPVAGLVRDSAGNLYGTAESGGASGEGVVFKLSTAGIETVLHSFTDKRDGGLPVASLIRDSAGNLYGTTFEGGNLQACSFSGCGVVFKMTAAGLQTVLRSFDFTDGSTPLGGVVRDSAGNLYGTTSQGGTDSFGNVFKISASGVETALYNFTGGSDGSFPEAGLVLDSAGNLYGTTALGGAGSSGVVFKIDSSGTYSVLYSFTGGSDGSVPEADLARDSAGNLYGTTIAGGDLSGTCSSTGGCGVVFRLDPTGHETVLHNFTGGPADGSDPQARVVGPFKGYLYGTTYSGGEHGAGVVFKLQVP